LSKIKLTVLNRNEIADKEQRLLKGGADYKCGCVSACVEDMCVCVGEDELVQDSNTNTHLNFSTESTASFNMLRVDMMNSGI